MNIFKTYTLKILGFLALSAFLIYIGLIITFQFVKDNVNERHNESIQFIASEISDEIIELKLMNNIIKLQQFLENYAKSSEIEIYKLHILNKNLEIIASSDIKYIKRKMTDVSYKQVKERLRSYVIIREEEGEKIIECAYPIKENIFLDNNDTSTINVTTNVSGILLVWQKPSLIHETLHSNYSSWAIMLVLLLLLFIIIMTGIYINNLFSNLVSISGTAKNLASGNLKERLKFDENSEFGLLAQSFNQIADNLESKIRETTIINKKLEESNLEKEKQVHILSQMAGGVAHEIRNPLGGIKGFAELLKNEIDPNDEKKIRYINYILDEVNTLEKLVQNVLDFARPKKPKKTKVFTEMLIDAINSIIENKIENIKKNNNVTIEYKYKINDNADVIIADFNQLRQVVLNLALNACDAMAEKGGTLEIIFDYYDANNLKNEFYEKHPDIITKFLNEAKFLKNGFIKIIVSDNGIGMDKKTLDNLFSPFFTTKSSGTGLGLSICKKIIENHNGFISVSSQLGIGSTFTIILPIDDISTNEQ